VATVYKVLGQLGSALTTVETVYTVPAATSAVVSTITACNTNGTAVTVRIYVVKKGGTASVANALHYDLPIQATDTFAITAGVTLGTGDMIRAYSSATNVCFMAFGSEVG